MHFPRTKEQLLAQGSCCYQARQEHSRCYNCPWWKGIQRSPPPKSDQLTAAIQLAANKPHLEYYYQSKYPGKSIKILTNLTIFYTND